MNQVAGQHDKEHGVWSILEGMIAMGWSIVSNIPENILFLVFIENKKSEYKSKIVNFEAIKARLLKYAPGFFFIEDILLGLGCPVLVNFDARFCNNRTQNGNIRFEFICAVSTKQKIS